MFSPVGSVVLSAVAVTLATAPTSAAAAPNRSFLASELAIPWQYHDSGIAVSDRSSQAVSRPISLDIVGPLAVKRSRYFQLDRGLKPSLGLTVEMSAAQYQQDADEPKRRLMLLVGVAFAAAYVVFVIGWIWATRLRSRPRRH